MISIYTRHKKEAEKYWQYIPQNHFYKQRFAKIKSLPPLPAVKEKVNLPVFEDGIDYKTPDAPGLYFFGETHFNPITHEEYYWVKIGMSKNFISRMRQYNTCNPMLWRIDYRLGNLDEEETYHYLLSKKAMAQCNHNDEWFLVDRNTYLEMCEKGFSYFD